MFDQLGKQMSKLFLEDVVNNVDPDDSIPETIVVDTKQSDLTIYGATGGVGRHVMDYLIQMAYYTPRCFADHCPGHPLRLTLAGRNEVKLQKLQDELEEFYELAVIPKKHKSDTTSSTTQRNDEATTTPMGNSADNPQPTPKPHGRVQLDIFCANATGADRLLQLASRTRVVINLAGPMSDQCGSDLVGACAAAGTHYVDISGHVDWAGRMRRNYGRAAAASGARICHMAGFSSILSDMAVFMAVQEYQDEEGPLSQIQSAECFFSLTGGPRPSAGALQTLRDMPLLQHLLPHRLLSNWIQSRPNYFCFDPLALIHASLRNNVNARNTLQRQYSATTSSSSIHDNNDPNARRHRDELNALRRQLSRAEWNNQWPQSHALVQGAYSAPMPTAAINAKVIYSSALSLNYAVHNNNTSRQDRRTNPHKKHDTTRTNNNKPTGFSYSERLLPLGFRGSIRFWYISFWPVVLVYYCGFVLAVVLLKLPIVGALLVWLVERRRQARSIHKETKACERSRVEVYAQVEGAQTASSKLDKANCCLKFVGDAGNFVTAQCVSEAALCLMLCGHPEEKAYAPRAVHPCCNRRNLLPPRTADGFGTPAELLGRRLVERLVTSPVRAVECTVAARKSTRMNDAQAFWRIYSNTSRKNTVAHIPSFATT